MRKTLCLIYFPFKLLIIVVFSPVISVGYWISTAIIVIPLYLFRKLLSFIAHILDPDLSKIVNSLGHLIARDYQEWYRSPSSPIVIICKLNGSPTLEEARQVFLRQWVHKSKLNNSKLEHPELQQYITKRLGFLFFKWDRNFDISNHVNLYCNKELLPKPESQLVNESTLMKIWESLLVMPLAEKRSPWDVSLIPNYDSPEVIRTKEANCDNRVEGKRSVIFIRFHHSLCDGASAYKLLLSLTDYDMDNLKKDVPVFEEAPFCMNLFLHLRAFVCGPTSMVQKLANGIDFYNPLHRPLQNKTRRYFIVKATTDLEIVKKIRRTHLDISFHSVLMAAVAGGVRNYLLGNGYKVPLSPIRMGIPIPRPGHTFKLRNEFLVSILDLPVDKKTPRRRLFETQRRINAISKDSFLPFATQTWQVVGLFPALLTRILTLKSAITVVYSEMKGPEKPLLIQNGKYELLDLVYNVGVGHDDAGIAFTSISYNEKIHIVLSVDKGIVKTRDLAQNLLNLIEKEFEELQYGDSTNL